jgi:hypothetical protein
MADRQFVSCIIHLAQKADDKLPQRNLICRVKLDGFLKMFVSTEPTVGFGTGWFNHRPLQKGWFDNSNLKRMRNEHVPGLSPMSVEGGAVAEAVVEGGGGMPRRVRASL